MSLCDWRSDGRVNMSPAFERWLGLAVRPALSNVVELSAAQELQIDTNTAAVSANASDIAANLASIIVNAAAISTNAGNIAANASAISSNTSLIAANGIAISAIEADVAALLTRIEALEFNAESLYVGQPAGTAAAIYTSTGVTTTLSAATAFNGSGGPETLDVWLVPSGDSEADANKLYEGLAVADGATVDLAALVGHALNPGDAVYALASTAATISVRLTGAIRS